MRSRIRFEEKIRERIREMTYYCTQLMLLSLLIVLTIIIGHGTVKIGVLCQYPNLWTKQYGYCDNIVGVLPWYSKHAAIP